MIYPSICDTSVFAVGATTKDDDFDCADCAIVHQVHGKQIVQAKTAGWQGDADGVRTTVPGLTCAIRVADCVPVVITRKGEKPGIAVLHSGRQGTHQNIVNAFFSQFALDMPGVSLQDVSVWMGPSICASCYEFGEEVKDLFDQKYRYEKQGKHRLDVASCVYDQVRACGVPINNVERSLLCTACESDLLRSWRARKEQGRSVVWARIQG